MRGQRRYLHGDTESSVNAVAYGVNVTVSRGELSLTAELTEDQAVEYARHLMWMAGYRALRIKGVKGSTAIDIDYEAANPHQFQYLKDAQDAETSDGK